MVLDGQTSQEYPVTTGVPQWFHSWYINDLPDDVIYNIAVYADNAMHLICRNNWNFPLNLNLIFERLLTEQGVTC